ncbi:MAG: acyl-CoA dehydratase activase-related protein [Bradymonadales bacterium]
MWHLGLDVGSTTVKAVAICTDGKELYSSYRRHFSEIGTAVGHILREIEAKLGSDTITVSVTGSAGLGLARALDLPFCQEVIASSKAVESIIPQTDVAIELGGEDAKITYFGATLDQRMNGTCAGGTGAFIDQMASLLETDAAGLDELARGKQIIYPIAARCGVFAKTDIQPLLNEGARREDIAASVFQAVVNQTVSVLACGHPIRGKVALLGGPLHFLGSLRESFITTLNLSDDEVLIPEDAHLFVAMGAALLSRENAGIHFGEILERMIDHNDFLLEETQRLEPLFKSQEEYEEFVREHAGASVARADLATYEGTAFLGIDAGSTTTKIALISQDGELLYHFYGSNEGQPLNRVLDELRRLDKKLPKSLKLGRACVTGYGEGLIKEALCVDDGEIETIAHYKAAQHFLPQVEFILDIGGQDMKCLRIRDGVIDSIMLNEACSSGCGSFIETFAKSLGYSVSDFAREAYFAPGPIDLGTRCTVFMNSRVKQAQKEGASVGEISAGLCYSVIKNALYKVVKLRNPEQMGTNVIVQGGTFYNDAVLRVFENVAGLKATRPDIAGLMGAFGAALIARERHVEGTISTMRQAEDLLSFKNDVSHMRCAACTNKCLLTINRFPDGKRFISGNRCERPVTGNKVSEIPNLYRYKHDRTFDYTSLTPEEATRGVVGIPRVLNLYENYPFWHSFLTKLGFSVLLSPVSTKAIYEKGLESIPSESACYPAKIVHGHIEWLVEQNPDFIFYPCIPYEQKEFESSTNHYNCPIVTSYPEVIRHNTDSFKRNNVAYRNPFFNLDDRKNLHVRLYEEFSKDYPDLTLEEVKRASELAFAERDNYKADIQRAGDEALEYIQRTNARGVVLAGRPYHVDPEIHHGIPEMITSFGIAVLTEDSVSHRGQMDDPLRVFDQWVYHSRLYAAARFVNTQQKLELIQLNSFGCGLDAVTTDQVHEILSSGGKIYTSLKIDEGNNIGAARIRIRSLKAALADRERHNYKPKLHKLDYDWPVFTKKMRKTHTIISPQMSPIHFRLIEKAFHYSGYNLVVLPDTDHEAVEEGLKYVNNDACYPSILTTGQIIKALKSGQYDPHETSVIITQTGGGCRATNYAAFIRKGLRDAQLGHIPVIALSAQGFEQHPGMKINFQMLHRAVQAIVYGDLLMRCLYRTRPYEATKGSAEALYEKWNERVCADINIARFDHFKRNCSEIVADFDALPLYDVPKVRVGIVGEILVKFHPTANNHVIDILESEGAEAVVPDLMGFFLYTIADSEYNHKYLGKSKASSIVGKLLVKLIEFYQKPMKEALQASERFEAPPSIHELKDFTEPYLQFGNQTGEGWFLTAEMLELIHMGVNNILCLQPFACLPNHVTGKGMIKVLRENYPKANIAAIDYDPGASEVNQLNRIKLMLSVAFRQFHKDNLVFLQEIKRQKAKRSSMDRA